jgi:hypothetical protein
MSSVLYYSKSCPHSVKLLQSLKGTELSTNINYICIDKRVKDPDGKVRIVLQNGSKVIMPPSLTSIPGLMLLNNNYQILYGDQIYQYLKPQQKEEIRVATENNMEPSAFSLGGSGFVVSDEYSFLDQDLESNGNGGTRQMHHYESLNQPPKPLGPQIKNDNIKQSNNRLRDGQINTQELAKQRGYNTRGFN